MLQARDFDVLITDVQMPNLNGLTLTDWVRRNHPQTRIVVITAYGSDAVQRLAVSKGAFLFLAKPVDPQLLVEVLASPETEGGFSGSVGDLDLFDCVQMVLLSRGRHLLEIRAQSGQQCRLWIQQGEVLHAESGELEGTDAFLACMGFAGGQFATLPWSDPARRSIDLSANQLLLEAARQRDETQHKQGVGEPEANESAPRDETRRGGLE